MEEVQQPLKAKGSGDKSTAALSCGAIAGCSNERRGDYEQWRATC